MTAPTVEVPAGLLVEDDEIDGVLSTAVMDTTRAYRYLLTRIWDSSRRPLVWVMLNPSTADHREDDATIRRLAGRNGFARREGAGGIVVVNLFALRSTDPRDLRDHPDPVGPYADQFIRHAAALRPVVAAWGGGGILRDRGQAVTRLLAGVGATVWALGVTSTGQPKHPLYLPKVAPLVRYEGRTA